MVGSFGRADMRAAHAERKRKGRARLRVPLLSGHEIYSGNWDTFLGEREAKKRDTEKRASERRRTKIMENEAPL